MDSSVRSSEPANYTVVARRYRPKSFDQLIGQDHIAQALSKAIETGRVGHAYLFTGARGVGKTSTARIFAKALNIPPGTSPELAAEIAAAIDAGEDIDVIEIDGASNRGIEEIRQLRSNVNIRPSRSPYRIYIIDEVHMLTTAAFNALLKTLEEPPAHVKFIFCTTDPDKVPITVLSRCQRFDFASVKATDIQKRLQEICQQEGFEADEAALALLARRANGSMRDSQSLLEQVMSFSSGTIDVETVNTILGTANESRVLELVERLVQQDALAALKIIGQSQQEGADAGQLAEQLLGFLRDTMALAVGGGEELLRNASPAAVEGLRHAAQHWGLQTLLAAIQIVDEAIVRMRSSVAAVTLLEVAVVEICNLEQFSSLPELVERLTARGIPSAGQKKNVESASMNSSQRVPRPTFTPPQRSASSTLAESAAGEDAESGHRGDAVATDAGVDHAAPVQDNPVEPVRPDKEMVREATNAPPAAVSPSGRNPQLSAGSTAARDLWHRAAARLEGMVADLAMAADAIEPIDTDHWRIVFPPGADHACQMCSQPERKQALLQALAAECGRTVRLTFSVREGQPVQEPVRESYSAQVARRMRELHEHPYIKRLCEELDGEVLRIDLPQPTARSESSSEPAAS
ncbi:MAG: DNA polymerase III, subunit gamma and tau [Pirellulaceae bacterium]|nr:MAG: DNA polymerase III, subunit gamma and tau [Pirellulaceae bacterium]GIX01009.1 MAG: DNA polymerase III, subunit gamma and tau [Pirellulaceae bacterium]